ncbi:DNA-3-methyladenine glycosylase [Halomonas sp. HNIBRBA4712]|uniref:DNA-3-methyladenine glycosylase n=1 Tax=Halomonas sp. HNIBRBA4712 TaxID=3373087 RepID=UPI003744FB72
MTAFDSALPASLQAPLPRDFYDRDTLDVARALLGCQLVRRVNGELIAATIVETEAYRGATDSACHAHRRRTPRTEAMFGPPGHAYVYLVYGMHSLLNIVTQPEGNPCAVLVRAVEPCVNEDAMRRARVARNRELCNGPGKLTRALSIDRALYGEDMTRAHRLWVVQGTAPEHVSSGPRVGIDYAEPLDRDAPWRLWVTGNPWVSKAR